MAATARGHSGGSSYRATNTSKATRIEAALAESADECVIHELSAASGTKTAWIWIAASALSLLPSVVLIARPVGSPLEFVMLGSAFGALGSVYTGLAVAWLLPRIRR